MHVYCNGEQAARPLDSASGVVVVVAYENGDGQVSHVSAFGAGDILPDLDRHETQPPAVRVYCNEHSRAGVLVADCIPEDNPESRSQGSRVLPGWRAKLKQARRELRDELTVFLARRPDHDLASHAAFIANRETACGAPPAVARTTKRGGRRS